MPTLDGHVRFVARGTGPGAEIWQTGIDLVPAVLPVEAGTLATVLAAADTYFTTWWNAIKSKIYNTYSFNEVRAYSYIGASTESHAAALDARTPSAGTLATTGPSIDQCLVVSLRSNHPGRSGRGRCYLPYHGAVSTTGLITNTADCATYASAVATLLNNIATANEWIPAVVSRHDAQYYVLVQAICDSRPDVQRRRQNRIVPGAPSTATIG